MSRTAKAIVLSSGNFLSAIAQLAIVAVLARVLTTSDYATYRQTLLVFYFSLPLFTLGLDRTLYFFLPQHLNRPRALLAENLLTLFASGLLLSLIMAGGGNKLLAQWFGNPELAETLLLLAPLPLLALPASSLAACLMGRDRTKHVAAFNIVSRLAVLALVVPISLVWPTPAAAVIGMVIASAGGGAVAIGMMIRACPGHWKPTISGIRRQLGYGVPLGLATLSGTITLNLDKMLVAAYFSPEDFATYVNGAMEIPLIGIITGSVTSVLLVDYARMYAEGRTAEMLPLFRRASVKCALLIFPAMAYLLCVAPQFMRVIYGVAYEDSASIFRTYLLLLPVRIVMFGSILQATGNNHHILIQSVLGLAANFFATLVAINLFGLLGAAWASVVVVYFIAVPYAIFTIYLKLEVMPHHLFDWRNLLKVGASAGIPAIVILVLSDGLKVPDLAWLGGTATAYSILVFLFYLFFGLLSIDRIYKALIRPSFAATDR